MSRSVDFCVAAFEAQIVSVSILARRRSHFIATEAQSGYGDVEVETAMSIHFWRRLAAQ